MIEDSPEDPRSKVEVGAPLRKRERREAAKKRLGIGTVGEVVSDDGF